MLEISLNPFDQLEVTATYEGKDKDHSDLEINIFGDNYTLGAIVKDVPYYNKKAKEITYEEAVDLYGEEAFEEDLRCDSEYLEVLKFYLYRGYYTVTTDKEVKIK